VSTTSGTPALTFKPYRQIAGTPYVASMEAAEVTGDGRTDLVAFAQPAPWEPAGHDLLLYPQQAAGGLGAPAHFPAAEISGATAIAVGDLTGDDTLDVAKSGSTGVRVWPGTGTAFGTSFLIPSADPLGSIALVDHGLDGDLDILSNLASGPGAVYLFTNDAGTFTRSTAVPEATNGVAAGDLTGDGRADIVRTADSQIVVYPQTLGGTFGSGVAYAASGTTLVGLDVGDVTGDDRLDVVALTISGATPALTVWAQLPGGTLAAAANYSSPGSQGTIDIADADGDGLNDVAVVHGGGANKVSLHRQQPDGSLGTEATYPIPSGLSHGAVVLTDESGDGRTDLIVSYDDGLLILDQAPPPVPAWIRDVGPADFASMVPTTIIPAVAFVREMDAASITSVTAKLLNGTTGLAVAAAVTYDPGTKLMRIDPSVLLAANTPYLVWIAGVSDAGGHVLAGPYVSRFLTKP
jgi:hypothetical protein